MHRKFATFKTLSEVDGGERLLYVYLCTAQVRPFVKKGCNLCYIHIYGVGVGVSLASVLIVLGNANTSVRTDIQGAEPLRQFLLEYTDI